MNRSDLVVLAGSAIAVVLAGVTRYTHAGAVLPFVVAAVAVALLASLVGRCVDQLGDRFGAGATGVLQSALGNLPELFIGYFALRSGLLDVVRAAVIGSILANILLVLGLAFVVGGVRHGTLEFSSHRARTTTVLLFLATAALVLPSVASYVHTPAEPHERQLSLIVSVVLLVLFVLSLPASLRRGHGGSTPASATATDGAPAASVGAGSTEAEPTEAARWPVWLAVGLLAASGVLAALVSDWFVYALQPAIGALHMSQAFAGLIVVAIAGNAVENFVGIQLAARGQADYAVSVIVNSPLQIALVLAPVLVLLSLTTATALTLVFAPMLVIAVVVSVLAVSLIVYDGESNWLEGATLIALYMIIATVFWWG
nr:calcium/proton exchanger [Planosporangium thailandense]